VTQRGPLARESLALGMLETTSQPERLAWLAQVLPGLEGSGVIYVLTVADTTRVASFLRTQGIDAHAYSSQTERSCTPSTPEAEARAAFEHAEALERFAVICDDVFGDATRSCPDTSRKRPTKTSERRSVGRRFSLRPPPATRSGRGG
jgi:hypothetical protein